MLEKKKKKREKMSTSFRVLFLMRSAPIRSEQCEGEEIGKHGWMNRLKKDPHLALLYHKNMNDHKLCSLENLTFFSFAFDDSRSPEMKKT